MDEVTKEEGLNLNAVMKPDELLDGMLMIGQLSELTRRMMAINVEQDTLVTQMDALDDQMVALDKEFEEVSKEAKRLLGELEKIKDQLLKAGE